MPIIVSYTAYLAVSLGVTIWVARSLQRNGTVFLVDAFHGDAGLADSVNHLLVVGFYLINTGYVACALSTNAAVATAREAIELFSGKIGVVLLVLGVMHFFNLYVLHRLRGRARSSSGRTVPAGRILD